MSPSSSIAAEPIPGYTVRERIGAGGYGEVWTAEAPGGLDKAIKFVYGYLDEARASRELKALNRIKSVRHPFLLSLERIEIVEGQLLIVTELAEGSLKDRYEECRKQSLRGIPRAELLSYMSDAAEALDYMSEKHGLQHLDVKPENLLLSARRVKVADFGLVKDLQDVNVSMMGGLTPVYAAPEVFSSQPSTRSDQYSLAILFQEMLTGTLPFPGRSAAQLASQHLSSRPNVSPLPEADRPVILRALSKDPQSRYSSCREMVELLAAAERTAAAAASLSEAAPAKGSTAPAANRIATQQIDSSAGSKSQPAAASGAGVARSGLHGRVAEQLKRELSQPLKATVQPPHNTSQQVKLRPQLIVSLGSAAALTTKAFLTETERLHGSLDKLPAIQWLHLDADPRLPREFEAAGYAPPSDDRMVIARLKRVQDYRNGSQHYLKWLSRRWLYNIPKSQTPENMRPLGRLAFVDHQREISERLGQLIERATDPAAMETTAAALGNEFGDCLRIVVIASSAGGVGGGALLDVGDWIRDALAQRNMMAKVQALLLHGTGRQSNRQELSVANTFATLMELHDRMRREWAGETQTPCPFDEVNMHLLGEHLAPEQWKEQTRNAARYLSLLLTPAGARWDAARGAAKRPDDELPPVHISSFQATVIGKSTDGLTDGLLDAVRAEVIRNWRLGTAAAAQQPAAAGAKPDPYQCCLAAVAELAAGLHLTPDALQAEIVRFLETAAQGSLPTKMVGAWMRVLEISDLESLDARQLTRAQRVAQEFLGIDVEGTREFSDLHPLDERSDPLIMRFLQSRASAVRELISNLAEGPATGIAGADRATDAFRQQLNALESELAARHDQQKQESARLVEVMAAVNAGAQQERGRAEPPRRDVLLMQYFGALSERLTLRKSLQVVRYLDDVMAELKRNLGSLDRELESLAPKQASDLEFHGDHDQPEEGKQTRLLRRATQKLMEQEQGHVAASIDADLREHALNEMGGFGAIVLHGKTLHGTLTEPLHLAVRHHVEAALHRIRLTEIVSVQQDMAGRESPAPSEMAELLQCGGTARWLLMLPDGSPTATLPNQVAERIQTRPAVDYHHAGEVTLFCLADEIQLSRAAAHLIGHAGQYAEVASRLLTRNDVDWLPLFVE